MSLPALPTGRQAVGRGVFQQTDRERDEWLSPKKSN